MATTKLLSKKPPRKRKQILLLDFSLLEGLRHAAELSREEVAIALGVTAMTVYRWERNRNQPDLFQLVILSRALGVPMHDLFAVREG